VTREGAPSRGSQRIERVHHDKWGYETERTDGSVRVGARGGLKRIRAIKEWHRLRRYAGLPDKYFHEVTEGKACVWPLPDVGKLTWERALWAQVKQFADARWLDANYKSPEKVFDGKSFAGLRTAWDRVHSAAPAKQLTGWPYPFITCTASPEPTRRWYRAPYVPFVNEHKNDKLKKGAGKYNTQRGEAILTDQYGPYRPGEEVIAHRWSPPPRVFKSSKAPRPASVRSGGRRRFIITGRLPAQLISAEKNGRTLTSSLR
jgi:hypothetical protein